MPITALDMKPRKSPMNMHSAIVVMFTAIESFRIGNLCLYELKRLCASDITPTVLYTPPKSMSVQ